MHACMHMLKNAMSLIQIKLTLKAYIAIRLANLSFPSNSSDRYASLMVVLKDDLVVNYLPRLFCEEGGVYW